MMLLRRVREHVVAYNWFAVAIDLAIVILGVFLGIQVSNWNEARIERTQGESYRARLIEDLRSNEADMQQRKVYYRRIRQHALDLLNAIKRPSTESGEDLLINAYQATHIMPREAKRFTYDEMLSAGGTEALGDANLRERLAYYYVGLTTNDVAFTYVAPYRDYLRQVMPYPVQQRIRTRCAEILGEDDHGAPTASLPDKCTLGLDPVVVSEAVARVRTAPMLEAYLTRHLIDLDLKLDVFGTAERRARELRQLMEGGND